MRPSIAECEDFHWTSAVDKFALQRFAESAPVDFVPCPFSPAVLSLLLQHSLQTGCSSGVLVNGVSVTVVGEVVDANDVK